MSPEGLGQAVPEEPDAVDDNIRSQGFRCQRKPDFLQPRPTGLGRSPCARYDKWKDLAIV